MLRCWLPSILSSLACVLPAFVDTCSTLGLSLSRHSSTRSAGLFLQAPIVQVWRSALSGAWAIRHSGIYGRSSSAAAALFGALRAQRFAALALDRPSDRCSLRHPACPALGNVWRWLGPHLLELAHGTSGARRSRSLWRLASVNMLSSMLLSMLFSMLLCICI